ncbi:MAG: Maf family protein [Candidatus Latescibacterota bacterium]|jgi:septum formation protein
MTAQLILASRSPRRRSLLEKLCIPFEIIASDVEEVVDPDWTPAETVVKLSVEKAQQVAAANPERLVLAADTIVVLDGHILGKPDSPTEAIDMLSRLSGRTHEVLTGVALFHLASDRKVFDYERTQVTFSSLEDDEIEAYVDSGSPLDKAGAYGIQDDRGSLFISGISGDYYNVVGLPLNLLYRLTKRHFPDLKIF